MRRLLIYFLIDVSESMVGEPINQVEKGMSEIIQELKKDPTAMETVWISVIVFAGQAKTIVPLQEIINFYPPKFPIGSGTSLGNGLGHLMYDLRKNFQKTTPEVKGDWKPIVFLFTDGAPTDSPSAAIQEWKNNWGKTANMVAISFGEESNLPVLKELTENVILFNNANPDSYAQFFRWVSDSIKTNSEKLESTKGGFELADFNMDELKNVEEITPANRQQIDDNFAILAGKCQKTKRPYLIKYKKNVVPEYFGGMNFNTKRYDLVGGFQVEESYFELSDENAIQKSINTEELAGAPSCPCCGNQHSFAVCQCGKIHCIGFEEINTCPWCGTTARYSYGGGDFDINRTQG